MKTPSLAVLLALVLAVPGAMAAGPSGAADFASQLMRRHAEWLSASERTSVDELNRRLREAEQQWRAAGGGAARDEAVRRREVAAAEFGRVLESLTNVVRVSLEGGEIRPPLTGPFTLPSDEGGLLLRLENGAGETRFEAQDLDQSRPEHSGTLRIPCGATGVTWVLLGFFQLPVGRTVFPVEWQAEGGAVLHTTLAVETPPVGRVRIDLLDGDTGKPTPAMVRMTSRAGGRDRKPAGVVDFGVQFDGNGSPTARRRVNLPGRLGGSWWCVDGPIDMTLPPGEYELAVNRGVEHVPVFTHFVVASGQQTSVSCRPVRWVDMRRFGWVSGDDHVHGRILSDDDAERLMAWVRAEDIHVANVVKMGDIYRTWFEQRGWGPEFRVAHEDYLLSPGQECPRTHEQLGHTLSMNTRGMIRDADRYYLYDLVADAVHAQGGLFGYAHVNSDLFYVHRDMTLNVPRGKIDFGEVLQFNRLGTETWYEFLDAGFKLTASAGSDVPWGGSVGEVRMYAYLGGEAFDADRWFRAVQRGRTFVTSGPMLEFRVDDALPGDEVQVDRRERRLKVRARTWGHPERSVPRRLAVVRHGEVLREVTAPDETRSELSLDFECDAADGFWIAARSEAFDGTTAHTTPVYVVRPPLRFWRYDRAAELIAKRRQSLAEIERLVADAREREKAGDLGGNHAVLQLARQGAELLERVAQARKLYDELERSVEAEKALRAARQ